MCYKGSTPNFQLHSLENYTEIVIFEVDIQRLSDQSCIHCKQDFAVSNPLRGPRRIDWQKFGQVISNKLWSAQINNIGTTDALKSKIRALERAFETAFKVSCSAKYSNKIYPRWLNEDLSSFRKLIKEVFNICYRHKDWQPYNVCLKRYKLASNGAGQNIESTSKSARLNEIMTKRYRDSFCLRKSEGSWTWSSAETMKLLVQKNVPVSEKVYESDSCLGGMELQSCESIKSVTTENNIGQAISSSSTYKSIYKRYNANYATETAGEGGAVACKDLPDLHFSIANRHGHESAKDF